MHFPPADLMPGPDDGKCRRAAAPAPLAIYFAGRAKRLRGLWLILGALGVPGFMYWRGADFDLSMASQVVFLGAILVALLAISAVGIERLFEPLPTLAVTREGVILFPGRRRPGVLRWDEIAAIEAYRIGAPWGESRFVSFVVDDPASIARHLWAVQRLAFRLDRAWLGENRYLRPQSDFERPVTEVAAELAAFRERLS